MPTSVPVSLSPPTPTVRANPGRLHRLAGVTALVVDDSAINLAVVGSLLEAEGATVVEATGGHPALAWLRAHPGRADLVLMDVQMPDLDGPSATRAIRAIPALVSLPIIALTAGDMSGLEQAARAAGMDDSIGKPIDIDLLVATILRLTQRPAAAPVPGRPSTLAPKDLARHLQLFARQYRDATTPWATATPAELCALAHRLKGAAATLGLIGVAQAAAALERACAVGGPVDGTALRAALADAVAGIDARLGPEPTPVHRPASGEAAADARAGQTGQADVVGLLRRCHHALNADHPDAVAPLLDALAPLVPGHALSALRDDIDRFDFCRARERVHTLARQLGVQPSP